MIDEETRLNGAEALPNKTFQYNYSLINYNKSELNTDTLRSNLEPGIIDNVKTNAALKVFRDNEVTLVYSYKDKQGVPVIDITVTPAIYNKE